MQRVGYDADTQVYTYEDEDGTAWESAPGVRYGHLHRGMNLVSLHCSTFI